MPTPAVALAWLAAHLPLLSSLVAALSAFVGIAGATVGIRAQRAGMRASAASTRRAEQDLADRPAHAWRDTAEALEKRLALVEHLAERVPVLEALAERVPILEAKVAKLERENLSLRLTGGKERKTISRLRARVEQLIAVIEGMGGTVPPELADPPAAP